MSKINLSKFIKILSRDRKVLALVVIIILAAIVYTIAVALSIYVSDVTVYTHYSGFGESHFYKGPWQYLILFALSGVIMAVFHIGIIYRLLTLDRRPAAFLYGWVGVALIMVGLFYALSVISLGRAV